MNPMLLKELAETMKNKKLGQQKFSRFKKGSKSRIALITFDENNFLEKDLLF